MTRTACAAIAAASAAVGLAGAQLQPIQPQRRSRKGDFLCRQLWEPEHVQLRVQPPPPDPNAHPCAPGARGGGRGPGRAGGPGGQGREPDGGRQDGFGAGSCSKWNLQGYQFDTDANGCSTGQLLEGGRFPGERGITTRPGQALLLREGQPSVLLSAVSTPEEIRSTFERNDWNQYHLVVRGNTFLHIINGKLASVTIDDDAGKRQQKGVIGIQIEGARRVSFRNVWLKRLS